MVPQPTASATNPPKDMTVDIRRPITATMLGVGTGGSTAAARTLTLVASIVDSEVPFPGAEHPAREYDLTANGVRIAVHEWGEEDAPPLLLVHGGFDFARTYDGFAPRLAAGGWRVVGWDQRGHGDSEHAQLYSWDADVRDALTVFDHVAGRRPVPVVGQWASSR